MAGEIYLLKVETDLLTNSVNMHNLEYSMVQIYHALHNGGRGGAFPSPRKRFKLKLCWFEVQHTVHENCMACKCSTNYHSCKTAKTVLYINVPQMSENLPHITMVIHYK